MNVELLLKVKERILMHPNQYDMQYFHYPPREDPRYWNCATTHCIGGWAEVIMDDTDTAEKLLNLSEEQATRLFHVDCWPERFFTEDRWTNTLVAADRIDFFILTEGTDILP